jgi:hypothetical protein
MASACNLINAACIASLFAMTIKPTPNQPLMDNRDEAEMKSDV